MPGKVAIRTVRVECKFMSDKDVKENRARDKVLHLLKAYPHFNLTL
jgi:hypothetical protein